MKPIVNQVEKELYRRGARSVIVHCWRGGMRSSAIAWILDLYGFEVYTLEGGYKRFRNWVLAQFEKPYQLRILGGYTGSAKTEILQELDKNNRPVVDLEGLAKHKGSSFGNLDGHSQDSTEHFENNLALRLYKLSQTNFKDSSIWVESESSHVGNVNIPYKFFNQMKAAPRINIEVPFEERLDFIIQGYGNFDTEKLIAATKRIQKRLGGLNTKNTIRFLENGDVKSAFAILLEYYDKAYAKSREKFQDPSMNISLPNTSPKENAKLILERVNKQICKKVK